MSSAKVWQSINKQGGIRIIKKVTTKYGGSGVAKASLEKFGIIGDKTHLKICLKNQQKRAGNQNDCQKFADSAV